MSSSMIVSAAAAILWARARMARSAGFKISALSGWRRTSAISRKAGAAPVSFSHSSRNDRPWLTAQPYQPPWPAT